MQVPFFRHQLDPEISGRVAEVVATPFLTSGAVGRGVEATLTERFDVAGAKLVNSWTNGAVAALLALGVGPGDEVIVPAMTFIASANVAALVGATVVFVDVDPDTLLIRPEAVVAATTDRTRAVIPVHLYGQMVDIAALRAAIDPRIAIVEDAAHAFEATLHGDPPGRHSDCAIFSFYATKNITCGEGGAIVSRRPELLQTIAQTVLHGMSAGAADRFEGSQYRHWDMLQLGTKANLPDLLAALLPPQIATVDDKRKIRETTAQRYLDGLPEVRTPAPVPGGVSAHHLFPIDVGPGERDRVLTALGEAGIGATVNYNPVPGTHYWRTRCDPAAYPVATAWGHGTLSLPLYPGLPPAEQDHVIQTLQEIGVGT